MEIDIIGGGAAGFFAAIAVKENYPAANVTIFEKSKQLLAKVNFPGGGVSLESIDFKAMQSKVCENLYFAGEVMDIDGITGGYNFQAAWTTAFIAAQLNQ